MISIVPLARLRREGAAAVALLAGIFVSHWCGYFPLRLCLTFWLGVLLARRLPELSAWRPPAACEVAVLAVLLCVIELAQAAQAGLLGQLDALALAALQTLMNVSCVGLVALAMTDGWAQAGVAVLACLAFAVVFWRLVERPAIDLSRRVGRALGEPTSRHS